MIEELTEPCPQCGSLLEIAGAPLFAERTCPVCGEQIHVNRRFAAYELLQQIGSGGQGTVYRARDLNLDREVALKVLRPEQGSSEEFVSKFEHEAKITASINHPNVVRVFSYGEFEGRVYLAMELVNGGTFDGLIERLGRVPEADALRIGMDAAKGLRAGFEKGLIHRDVKPGNILFASDGSAKMVDFGLAVFHEQQAAQTGDIWGTPYYLSPERLNREQEDFRSDIYSLGAALFHAIAGRPPFEAEDASHVALKHLSTQAVSLQTFAPHVSNATAYVINRTLLKNRDERQATYDEFIEQLQFAHDEAAARARGGGAQRPRSRVVLEDEVSKKAMGKIMLAVFALLVVGLTVGGYLIFKAARGGEEAPPGGPARLESFGPGWAEARQLLMDGKWKDAQAAFLALSDKASRGSKQQEWGIIHAALAAQFGEGSAEAAKALSRLADPATPVRKFFLEQIRPKLAAGEPVPAAAARDFNGSTHEALGALFLALANYERGSVENAGRLFSQFTDLSPAPELAWLEEYRKLAKPYHDEFVTFNLAADAWKNARNPKEQLQALNALGDLPRKLPKQSKLLPRARELLAEAQKKQAAAASELNKSNFAYKAAVRASASTPKEGPENAVDGNPATRWSAGGDGEKWLAVDLGSPRRIGRWALTTSAEGGEQLAAFKLQRSDDGATWADVDTVLFNRSTIVDRLVEPFNARHARILVTKETRRPGDKIARIHEIVLSADAQTRPAYDSSQSVAVRFSPKVFFITGPVGDPGIAGGTQFADAGKKFTVKGGGTDIGGTADNFQFAWRTVSEDCELVARVESVQPQVSQAKFGLMVRADLARDASQATIFITGGKLRFLNRPAAGKPATVKDGRAGELPRWLKIARRGGIVVGYESADGSTWAEVGRERITGIEGVVFVGMAVCSHSRTSASTVHFSDVKLDLNPK